MMPVERVVPLWFLICYQLNSELIIGLTTMAHSDVRVATPATYQYSQQVTWLGVWYEVVLMLRTVFHPYLEDE